MPSSLIIVALVVAWLVVLVPMIARKRQEVTKTADSALASRVVRSGDTESADTEEELAMAQVDEPETEEYAEPRPYRPGRGGYDAEAAAAVARAKYAFRQRMVLLMLLAAIISGVVAAVVLPVVWWAHGAVDLMLVGYLVYLRRQVRIEADIRQRRGARTRHVEDLADQEEYLDEEEEYETDEVEEPLEEQPRQSQPSRPVFRPRQAVPGTVVVDIDDEDPAFEDLDVPQRRTYRRAVGE